MDGKPVFARFPLSIRNEEDQEHKPSQQGEKSKIRQLHNLLPRGGLQKNNAQSCSAFPGASFIAMFLCERSCHSRDRSGAGMLVATCFPSPTV
jgi:hypothetical protein